MWLFHFCLRRENPNSHYELDLAKFHDRVLLSRLLELGEEGRVSQSCDIASYVLWAHIHNSLIMTLMAS